MKHKPKIALAGSVNSTLTTLNKLVEHKCELKGVLSLSPDKSKNVSGYKDLKPYCEEHGIPCRYFNNINDEEVVEYLQSLELDYLFIIGLSQLARKDVINIARKGNIGFHPTRLPEGRGRAAVAWILLGKAPAAATFFLIDEGMDSGDILGQRTITVDQNTYADDLIRKIQDEIGRVLDDFLPELNAGTLQMKPQDHTKATYLGKRKPKDGLIKWAHTSKSIFDLIRATSRPLPGAYSFYEGQKIVIHRAEIENQNVYVGVSGRVLEVENESCLVACQDGAIWIHHYEAEQKVYFKIGKDFTNE